ncbi:MAG: AI-2E family transporter [Candidatus Dadabacteria bacterium]|nr:AI-2E family transporter [Candidatus Dadabacteria bacterium]NIS08068.1 AI-2E family transporter [Candidatus Dadabacteria bacterium]NIV42316.1 AI-2E family transporter [Candidatus Dadabacteria bacterium]NIX14811.1 AI-2E family transporter [Candidatus Dadabacteria bacterium]NIY21352.1 AI-2E family transporter [Candidatus Dadabacteria bacterium]
MTRNEVVSWFFIGIFLYLMYLFIQVIKPFILPLFWAAILTLILYPAHEKLTKLLKNRANLSAIIMTLLTVWLIVIPLFLLVSSLALEMIDIYSSAKSKGDVDKFASFLGRITEFDSLEKILPGSILQGLENKFDLGEVNVKSIVVKSSKSLSGYLVNLFKGFASNVTSMLFSFGIMIFSLFFFFRDGREMFEKLKYLIPMNEEQKNRTFNVFRNTIDGVVVGSLATAAVQGLLVLIIFLILGISYPVLAGSISFVLSILPLVGATFVWLPVSIFLMATGVVTKGIILLVFGVVVISMSDNIIRPMIIGGKVKLPTFFLLISIMGGLDYFGFSGVILGPVLLAVFLSFIEIYKQEYRDKKAV